MTAADPAGRGPATPDPGTASVPAGLVTSVVDLVHTGPVHLGAYTIAELTAVDAIVDFLEARPSDEVLAEAVARSRRASLVAGPPGDQVQFHGDLGIAVVFQQRAQMVLDARATGTEPGEPWRPAAPGGSGTAWWSGSTHSACTNSGCTSWTRRSGWSGLLPRGSRADNDPGIEADQVLGTAERMALVTVTRYTAEGSAEVAGASTDLVLARRGGDCMSSSVTRGPRQVVPSPRDGKNVRETLASLLGQPPGSLRAGCRIPAARAAGRSGRRRAGRGAAEAPFTAVGQRGAALAGPLPRAVQRSVQLRVSWQYQRT